MGESLANSLGLMIITTAAGLCCHRQILPPAAAAAAMLRFFSPDFGFITQIIWNQEEELGEFRQPLNASQESLAPSQQLK